MISLLRIFNGLLVKIGSALQSLFLLIVRLYWGWQFFGTGKAKLMDVPTFVERFHDWGIPFPKLNVYIAGSTECFGGLLLLVGLCSRIISVPLIFTMVVAYLTADIESVKSIWSDPDKFVYAAPFQFMFAAIIVFIFGPGAFSLD